MSDSTGAPGGGKSAPRSPAEQMAAWKAWAEGPGPCPPLAPMLAEGDEIGPTGAPPGCTPMRRSRARIQRREVERVSPEEQDRRWAAMLDNLEALNLARLRERWPLDGGGEGPRALAILADAAKAREAARLAQETARITAERKRLGLEAAGGGSDVLERASRYLAAIPGGSSGQGRSNGAFGVAVALVRGWALPEGVALSMLEREYAPRCKPRWTHRELVGMVRRASRATRTGYGWLLEGRAR